MRGGRVARILACVAAGVLGAAVPSIPAGAAPATRLVQVSTRTASVGEVVRVTGSGWAPVGQTVQIELCGHDALDLSNDCDQTNQYTAAIRSGGIFYGALTLRMPPTPCPCVLLISNQGSTDSVKEPIAIAGAPYAAIAPPSAPKAPVALATQVEAPPSPGSWFGGPKDVTLVLRVTNISTIDYSTPTLSVTVGRGDDPTGFVVARPMAALPVGATQTLRIPVSIPPFTFGHYTIRAQVITGQGNVTTLVPVSSYPWGLLVLAIVVVGLVVMRIRRRIRRRRIARQVLPTPDEALVAQAAAVPDSPAPVSPVPVSPTGAVVTTGPLTVPEAAPVPVVTEPEAVPTNGHVTAGPGVEGPA